MALASARPKGRPYCPPMTVTGVLIAKPVTRQRTRMALTSLLHLRCHETVVVGDYPWLDDYGHADVREIAVREDHVLQAVAATGSEILLLLPDTHVIVPGWWTPLASWLTRWDWSILVPKVSQVTHGCPIDVSDLANVKVALIRREVFRDHPYTDPLSVYVNQCRAAKVKVVEANDLWCEQL